MANEKILTAEQEIQLRKPIDDYVGKIQKKIDALRLDGVDKVISLQNDIDAIKRDHVLTKAEKETAIAEKNAQLEKAKGIEQKNQSEISKLVSDAENYLNAHFDNKYYKPVKESCKLEKESARKRYVWKFRSEPQSKREMGCTEAPDRARSRQRTRCRLPLS